MRKKILTMLLVACIGVVPVQVFGATKNHIPYINKTDVDQVHSTQVIVDNTYYDLKPGQYFTIILDNAEFDLDDDGEVRIRSNSFEFGGSSKTRAYGKLKDSVTEGSVVSFSFYSKVLGGDAKVIIEPEDSGISGGTYLYAITNDSPTTYTGRIEPISPMFFDESLVVPPIVIKEQGEATFRTIQMYNTDNKDFITIMPESDLFKIRSAGGYHNITFVVEDGKGNSERYELGRDQEVDFNYTTNKLTFKKVNDDIFDTQGRIYTIRIENMEILPEKDDVKEEDIKLVFDGLIVDKQTITLGQSSLEPLKLEASEKDLVPGTRQKIKFVLDEQRINTLFKQGYINLGIYGGATIDSKSDLKFTLKDGLNTYTELEKEAFKLNFDSLGDRVTIEEYRRKSKDTTLKLEGELTVTVPENASKDIQFFINEPSLSEVVKQTVLKVSEKNTTPEQPDIPTPELPKPETPEPIKPKVDFIVGKNIYKVDGVSRSIDAKPYISSHNRIMVPVRYVAYALGVEENDLQWDGKSGTITIKADSPITINLGTKEMAKDSVITTLSEIKVIDGRTFVPVGEIAKAFGSNVTWDQIGKIATFK